MEALLQLSGNVESDFSNSFFRASMGLMGLKRALRSITIFFKLP